MRNLALILLLVGVPQLARSSPLETALAGAELRGSATFRILGLPFYDARLFTKAGEPLDWSSDFALELNYRRALSQFDLVQGTLRELERTGSALPARSQLEGCFQGVRKGDSYLAVSNGQNELGFWRNGKQSCTLAYPKIKTRFMAIFLGENTRSKSFTRQLKAE